MEIERRERERERNKPELDPLEEKNIKRGETGKRKKKRPEKANQNVEIRKD